MALKNPIHHQLSEFLRLFPEAGRFCVAFSGGIDSTVLLHSLNCIHKVHAGMKMVAIHINHHISQNSDIWADHCVSFCKELGVNILVLDAAVNYLPGESPENCARIARYDAIMKAIKKDDVVLVAHNSGDQAETLILQLLRGSGPKGLSAMPVCRKFGHGKLARPLLDIDREQISQYAQDNKLNWVEDESNEDVRYDRNYVRHRILPVIESRWKSLRKTLKRSALHQRDVAVFLDAIGREDLEKTRGHSSSTLALDVLVKFDRFRQNNVIRTWLQEQGFPLPTCVQLNHIINDVVNSKWDRMPLVTWKDVEVRRYRNILYADRKIENKTLSQVYQWDITKRLQLSQGVLEIERKIGFGIKRKLCKSGVLEVRFRQGGEKCRPAGRQQTHTLKKIFQESGIPPWERGRIPLIFINKQLACVPGLCVCYPFQVDNNEDGYEVIWKK